MSNYSNELAEAISMYEEALPEGLKEDIHPRYNTLEIRAHQEHN